MDIEQDGRTPPPPTSQGTVPSSERTDAGQRTPSLYLSRKGFLAGSAATLASSGLLTPVPTLAKRGTARKLPPGHAKRRALSRRQTMTLVAWCELLVPGAARAGVGDFVNAQLSLPHEEARLMLRYLTWDPPYKAFYADGLAALSAAGEELFGRPFALLEEPQQGIVRDRVLEGTVSWQGPPPGLFYFVTRGDGVDVVYGTVSGFARIDFPYRPLIEPRRDW